MAEDNGRTDPEPSTTDPAPIPIARPLSTAAAQPAGHNPDFLLLADSRRAAWVDVALMIVAVLLFEVATGAAIVAIFGPVKDWSDEALAQLQQSILVPVLSVRAAFVLCVAALILRRRGQTAGAIGVTTAGLGLNVILGLAATGVAYVLIIAWQFMLMALWPDLPEQMEENIQRLLALVPKLGPLGYAGFALVIGLYEELLFRGFIMPRLRRATNSWVIAVLLTTVAFVLPHMLDQTLAALGPITILALTMSLLTIWRRSIIPAIIAHALFDLTQFIALSWWANETLG